jgi:uncharacterized coiled-coil protein SlyX
MNVPARRTIRSVPPDLSKSEVKEVSEFKEEGNLLIEAVSLLVQRQRETEGWVAEQIWQAEERASAAERRYADLEDRLSGIEEHLSRLVNELEPAQDSNAQVDERLSRLREQVEDLKAAGTDGRLVAPPPRTSEPQPSLVAFAPPAETAWPAATGAPTNVGFLDLLGCRPADRWGAVLIAAGAVAVLFAVLTSVRFG